MVKVAFQAGLLLLSEHGSGASEKIRSATKCEGCRKEGLLTHSSRSVCVTFCMQRT